MLTRLSVKNFRLLRDVTLDVPVGKPIVLIGPNSSGKSSVLQVLDLLGRAGRDGWASATRAYEGFETAIPADATEGCDVAFDVSLSVRAQLLRYAIDMDSLGIPERERLTVDVGGEVTELASRLHTDLRIKNAGTGSVDIQEISREDADGKLAFEIVKQPKFYPALEDLRGELARFRVYDRFLTTPLWVRDLREGRLSPFDSASIAPASRIDRRGLNLINALYHLQANHPEEWEELLDAFRAEFPFVARIHFPADPAGGRIALAWGDRRYPGVQLRGHQMSEGMTAYLCLLAAILSPDPVAAIGFDEPDAHLHPSALRRVVELLERLSTKTTVFVATHSDRFLDFLTDPAGSIRVCEPTNAGVTIRPLDGEALNEWRRDYSLSELRERGHLDSSNGGGLLT